jgi:hypothetical protein
LKSASHNKNNNNNNYHVSENPNLYEYTCTPTENTIWNTGAIKVESTQRGVSQDNTGAIQIGSIQRGPDPGRYKSPLAQDNKGAIKIESTKRGPGPGQDGSYKNRERQKDREHPEGGGAWPRTILEP